MGWTWAEPCFAWCSFCRLQLHPAGTPTSAAPAIPRHSVPEEQSGLDCMCAGALQWQPPLAPQQLCGGVLADEMGLGKTVICLALILQNAAASRKQPRQGGTLIAATPALMGQWESEVSTAGHCNLGAVLVTFDESFVAGSPTHDIGAVQGCCTNCSKQHLLCLLETVDHCCDATGVRCWP